MNIPSEKNFTLGKVKSVKDGGLDAHYEVQESVGAEVYVKKVHEESAKDMHPDLAKCFKDLRPIMARIFNLTSFHTMLETPEFKATEKQKTSGREFADELLDKIDVRGISLSGQDDNVGVAITAVLTVMDGQKTCINSPRIKFASVKYGFEEELETIISTIESEVYQFLFKGKKAQLELFGADGNPSEAAANAGADGDDAADLFPVVKDPADENDPNDENDPEV